MKFKKKEEHVIESTESGIYCYYDLKKDEIAYIGLTVNFHKRDKAHRRKKGSKVPFDYVLRDHPKRYVMKILLLAEENLGELEREYIKKYNPKHNWTEGGEHPVPSLETRQKMRENHWTNWATSEQLPMYGMTKELSPVWKSHARVVKHGKDINGKQNFGLKYDNTILKISIDPEVLQTLCDSINNYLFNGRIIFEDTKKHSFSPYTRKQTDYAYVFKAGKSRRGEQVFKIRYNNKFFNSNADPQVLQTLCDGINNHIHNGRILFDKTLKFDKPYIVKKPDFKYHARVTKDGKNKKGNQYYTLRITRDRIKGSPDPEILQTWADGINNYLYNGQLLFEDTERFKSLATIFSRWKVPARVSKDGKNQNSKQRYALYFNKKRIKRSLDNELLQTWANGINNELFNGRIIF